MTSREALQRRLAPRRLATAVKAGLHAAGHYARRLADDTFPGVAVLCYHGVRPDEDVGTPDVPFANLHVRRATLEAHCRLLRASCQPISLDAWRAALDGGPPLPPRPVLVTFDDGYRSVHRLARPILARYQIPAVVFACSDAVAGRSLLWYDALARARGEAAVEPAKALPFAAWRALVEPLAAPVADDHPQAVLTVEELQELARAPGLEIGSHTASHAILARADSEEQRRQIGEDRERLGAWIGRPVRAFAYPNGRPDLDYTDATARIVSDLGFDFAFNTRPGFATAVEPRLKRSRFLMLADVSAAELAHRLTYSWRGRRFLE